MYPKTFMTVRKKPAGSRFDQMWVKQKRLQNALKSNQDRMKKIKLEFNVEGLTQQIEDLESVTKHQPRTLAANPSIKELNDYLFNSVTFDINIQRKI